MNNIIRPSYKEEVTQYTKKDAINALLYAAYITLMALSSSILAAIFHVNDNDGRLTLVRFLWGLGFTLFTLVPLFVIVKIKGQGLRSLGLHLIGWKKALFTGLFFVVVFLMLFHGLLPGLLDDWTMHSPEMIVWIVVYVIIMAVWEDIVYVGYIQTRIYGFIERDFLAIGTGGIIFALMHFPGFFIPNILSGDGLGHDFWLMFVGMTLSWIMGHLLVNTLFRQFRSIIVVTLFHSSSNVAIRGDLWAHSNENGMFMIFLISGSVAFSAFLFVTAFLPYLKKCRATV